MQAMKYVPKLHGLFQVHAFIVGNVLHDGLAFSDQRLQRLGFLMNSGRVEQVSHDNLEKRPLSPGKSLAGAELPRVERACAALIRWCPARTRRLEPAQGGVSRDFTAS